MGKLSIVMATINDSIATNFTLAQILYQLQRLDIEYEIILVDNGDDLVEESNLKTFLNFHKNYPISYFKYPIKGTIPPHSFGVTKATGKYIMMPDPHLIFSPDYFKVMIETIEEYKDKNVAVVFSPFSVGEVTSKDNEYICGSHLITANPFGKTNGIGISCKEGIDPFSVLSCTISSCILERKWMLKIGNMFPDAFVKAGGHTAESLLIGITTWMFGKRCIVQPKATVEHFSYRSRYGSGRNANMFLSMATGAYILGGHKYVYGGKDVESMTHHYGEFVDGDLKEIKTLAKEAREYVLRNQVYSLDHVVANFEEMKNAEG